MKIERKNHEDDLFALLIMKNAFNFFFWQFVCLFLPYFESYFNTKHIYIFNAYSKSKKMLS